MGTAFNDTFTDTALDELSAAHTSDSGHSWTKVTGLNVVISDANRARGSGTSAGRYRATLTSALDAGSLTAIIRSHTAQGLAAIAVRYASGADTAYVAAYSHTTGQWDLYRLVAGSFSASLASSVQSWTDGTDKTCVLAASGTGATVTVTLTVGGSELINYADTDAARITAAGYLGVHVVAGAGTSTQLHTRGLHYDTLTMDDGVAAGGQPTIRRTGLVSRLGVPPVELGRSGVLVM